MTRFQSKGRDLIWNGDKTWWGSHAPLLFPIVGNAPDGRLSYESMEVDINRHGFARTTDFELVDSGETHVIYRLVDTAETRAIYPFSFAMTVTYRLLGNTLTNTVEIENTGGVILPFGFGFHPAFLCPLPGSEGEAHHITLENGAEPELARLTQDKHYVRKQRDPSPFKDGIFAIDRSYFDEDAMIFPEGSGDALLVGAEGGAQLAFTFTNLPHLAIWAPAGDCPFVCIEPWSGMCAPEGASNDIRDPDRHTGTGPRHIDRVRLFRHAKTLISDRWIFQMASGINRVFPLQ